MRLAARRRSEAARGPREACQLTPGNLERHAESEPAAVVPLMWTHSGCLHVKQDT